MRVFSDPTPGAIGQRLERILGGAALWRGIRAGRWTSRHASNECDGLGSVDALGIGEKQDRFGAWQGKAWQGVGSMGRRVQDNALALTECEKLTLRKSTSFDRDQYIASCCTLQSRTKRDLEKPVLDLESLIPITDGQFSDGQFTCWQI